MAMHTRATPGVYAMERSSRVLTGILPLISILPPRCMRNVRSDTCTTLTPLVAGLERQVTNERLLAHLHEVDGADVATGFADGGCDLAQHAGLVLDFES